MRTWLALTLAFVLACDNSSGPGVTLDVTPDSAQLVRNDSALLSVTALDGDGHLVTGVAVSFASADTDLVTVSNLGMIHSHSALGRTTIRVRGGGAITDLAVTVTATPSGVLLAPNDTTIRATAILQYRAAVLDETGDTIRNVSLTWQSNDTTIATVTSTGLATAKSTNGATFITARYGGFVAGAILRVVVPGVATQITLTPTDTAILSGASVQMTATARDGLGDPVPAVSITWSSENPLIATVSGTGFVHSQGPSGIATIRATSGTVSATAPVTVLDSMILARTMVPNRSYAAAISVANVAYVSQSDLAKVLRIDLASHAVTESVTVGSTPTEMAFNSTGTRLYVTNQYSSTVSVIEVSSNTEIETIPVGDRPFELIVAPGDSILYVGKIDSVYGIRLATKAIVARFQVGAVANGVAIAQDTLLYVSTHESGTVVEINLRTRSITRTFAVGGIPQKLAVSPNGAELYIANQAGYVQFWNLVTGLQIGTNLTLPDAAYGIARRSSNGLLYATSAYFGNGYIYVIDPVTRTLLHSAVIGGSTRHIVFTADGSVGIVPNEGGWVDFLK